MSAILETRDLCKYYGTGENQVKAVNHTSISIEKGEFAKSKYKRKKLCHPFCGK